MERKTGMLQSDSLWKGKPHDIEERLNAVTHSIGVGLSIAGLVFLLVLTSMGEGGTVRYVSFSLYGAFQILLYLSSAMTHQFSDMPRMYNPMRILDQSAIYLLIAGTYTPAALLVLPGAWGWWIFGIVWTLAVMGIIMKTCIFRDQHLLSDLLYLPMGWLLIVAIRPFLANSPDGLMKWIVIGGLSYTLGVFFYVTKRIPFSHVIWHLFVLSGGISFYLGFAFYLT